MTSPGAVPVDLAAGLSRALGVPVSALSASTAGARRTNIVFEAGGRPYVATIVPAWLQGTLGEIPIGAEAAVRDLAERAGVPVPHVEFVTEDPSYVGGPLLISDFVPGQTVPRRILRLVAAHPGLGDTLAEQLGASMARLHVIDPGTAPAGLARTDEPPAVAELAVFADAIAALPQRRPALEFGLRWLERHLPDPPPRPSIVHGDVRNGNLIVGEDGLRAVLDWELARAHGDPMDDLAWTTLRMWRFGNDQLEVGGFASRQVLVAGYTAAGGAYDADRFEWWKVAHAVRWALGLADQTASYLAGDAPSIVMAASGRRVSELEWDLLMLTRPRQPRRSQPA